MIHSRLNSIQRARFINLDEEWVSPFLAEIETYSWNGNLILCIAFGQLSFPLSQWYSCRCVPCHTTSLFFYSLCYCFYVVLGKVSPQNLSNSRRAGPAGKQTKRWWMCKFNSTGCSIVLNTNGTKQIVTDNYFT